MSLSKSLPLLLLLLPANASADAVFLRSGEIISGRITSADSAGVTISGKTAIPRNRISELRFIRTPAPVPKTRKAEADAEAARASELFAQADSFARQNPGADGLVLRNDADFEYRANGTWVSRMRFAGQILKPSLIESWHSMAEALDDGRERVRILRASVYCPGGAIYPFDQKNLKVSSPQAEDLFFLETRLLTYTFPRLSAGCIIDTEVERDTYNPFRKDFFFPQWVFSSNQPTFSSTLSIKMPPGKELFYSATAFPDGGRPAVSKDAGGASVYVWKAEKLPPLDNEPSMPAPEELSPRVKGSLFRDWKPVSDWFAAMHSERLALSPEMKAFADKLTARARTPEEKTALFYHWIQRNIRYVAVKLGVSSNWGGYSAKKTWARRYGCCIDKSLLLCAFLRYCGIDCSTVILDTNLSPAHDMSLPDIDFEHAITWVSLPSGPIFLDSTGYDHRFPTMPESDYGVYALNVFKDTVAYIPPPTAENNASSYRYEVAISTSGKAVVSMKTAYNGPREGELRGIYKEMDEEYRARSVAQWINETVPGASIKTFRLNNEEDLDKPFSLELGYEADHYLARAGDIAILTVPDLLLTFPEAALRERVYPIKYAIPSLRDATYEITLPPGYEPVALPQKVVLTSPYADFSIDWSYSAGKVKCALRFARRAISVPPADYPRYREFLRSVTLETDRRVFLRLK